MRIIGNLASFSPVKVEPALDIGGSIVVNGQFVVPVPEGVSVTVNSNSYFSPADAGSLPALIASGLVGRYPAYQNAACNFFLYAADVALLDLSSSAPAPQTASVSPTPPPWNGYVPGPLGPRCQVGRGTGSPTGVAPSSVALLPRNTQRTGGSTYGGIVTDTLDITSLNPTNPGSKDLLLWWDIATVSASEDIVTGYGVTLGEEAPTSRTLTRLDPETAGFYAYASVNDGVDWYRADYLTATDLVNSGTDVRLAFINTTTTKIYLLGYAALIQDLP